jgi:MerR family transcriptional regulator, light-induced transcriptional regulator
MDRMTRDSLALGLATAEATQATESWENREQREGRQQAREDRACAAAEERMRWLARTIEAEIIPRLMLAHTASRPGPAQQVGAALVPVPAEVEAFARLAIAESASASAAFVDEMRMKGMALDVIYMELLAPAARRLGELWEADLCDFSEVTLGLWRIQQVMYDLSPAFHRPHTSPDGARRALLAPAPHSQHTFGLLMVSEFFRRAGWDVWARTSTSEAELISAAQTEWFDVCGLSIGSECHVELLTSVILKMRTVSRNKALVVMVGGPIVLAQPELVARVGADATAMDAAAAVAEAHRLVAARPQLWS